VGSYLRPRELDEALRALRAAPRVVLAGGTDHYPARVGRPADEDILDITAIGALRRIEETDAGWRIPALCTWSDVIAADLPRLFDGLKAAAREVGGVQIQNAGTVCGNLCNASPAADGVPCLMALDAEVELASLGMSRRLKIEDFVEGNRRTARRPDELVIALHVKRPGNEARGAFLKLGARRYLVISIVMAAGVIEWRDGRVAAARLAIGACAPTALRLRGLEERLRGVEARRLTEFELASCDLDMLAPIDDVRASAGYRTDASLTLVRRLLAELRP
jgi:CO/xanthine dehydrogenase FAD-binding subunit